MMVAITSGSVRRRSNVRLQRARFRAPPSRKMLADTLLQKEEFENEDTIVSGVLALLLIATVGWASSNLNSSRSNTFRLTYPSDLVNRDQAKAILAELDKMRSREQGIAGLISVGSNRTIP